MPCVQRGTASHFQPRVLSVTYRSRTAVFVQRQPALPGFTPCGLAHENLGGGFRLKVRYLREAMECFERDGNSRK